MRDDWIYTMLCLALPLGWGILSARVFDFFQARRAESNPAPGANPNGEPSEDKEMYYI